MYALRYHSLVCDVVLRYVTLQGKMHVYSIARSYRYTLCDPVESCVPLDAPTLYDPVHARIRLPFDGRTAIRSGVGVYDMIRYTCTYKYTYGRTYTSIVCLRVDTLLRLVLCCDAV